jgi:aerotaxis receptor
MESTFTMFRETEVPENEEIISLTDFSGTITYINETFAEISGYTVEELIGKPHSLIKHPDMPKSTFVDLWKTLRAGETWEGYVKNLRKDGGYYWVFARISTVLKGGKAVGYKSVREPVSKEKRIEMQNHYDLLRSEEEHQSRVVLYIDNNKLDAAKALEG